MQETNIDKPSRSSREAPPPVDTWDTLSSVPHFAQHVAVSPPPIMVVEPALVTSTTISMTALVPLANLSNSNTPQGLQETQNKGGGEPVMPVFILKCKTNL